MALIKIDVDNREVLDMLARLQARASDLRPAMQDIGEHPAETTKRRFATATAPDGSRWAPNSRTTLENYLGRFSSSFAKKSGKLSKAGAARAINKKPLTGETGSLKATINYQASRTAVEIGSPMVYAAVQQYP